MTSPSGVSSANPNTISRENLAVGAAAVAAYPRGVGATADNSDVAVSVDAIRKANRTYTIAQNYYDSRTQEAFSSIRMRRAIARTGLGFRFGFAAIPVDAVSNRDYVTLCRDRAGCDRQGPIEINRIGDAPDMQSCRTIWPPARCTASVTALQPATCS